MKSLLQFLRQLQFWLCPGQMHYIHGADTLPPPLSAPEERAMLEALANGNTDAREQLIVHNLRLVVYIAKKFESTGIGLEDLISIGTIGLIKAVNTFCPTKKIKLATYASRCIENEILMFLRKATQYRGEVSIDEPLNIDWDGNDHPKTQRHIATIQPITKKTAVHRSDVQRHFYVFCFISFFKEGKPITLPVHPMCPDPNLLQGAIQTVSALWHHLHLRHLILLLHPH